MAILRSRFVMTTQCDYLKTSVFITVAAIVTTLTGIVAPKHMQTTFFIGLTLI
jgi:hypothetical protein